MSEDTLGAVHQTGVRIAYRHIWFIGGVAVGVLLGGLLAVPVLLDPPTAMELQRAEKQVIHPETRPLELPLVVLVVAIGCVVLGILQRVRA